ncbi:YecA family protein [Duganella dendranthematis]|uniref:YecA family protein n=1 Tax=Duganella dendranthematis TaxID=2728021 RepID=UPI001E4354B1|nr:SEC-C metal-binding domain-containing protein [Duganella dendranthematis]
MAKKIGRNDPCPCDSGKKFKKCHGRHRPAAPAGQFMTEAQRRAMAIQRERQQGLGRPIISGTLGAHRVVAVKNRILFSTKWKTFHDFLFDYIKGKLTPEWGTNEMARPVDERHPILVWYDNLCRQQQKHANADGTISSMPANGAAISYLRLAYDLYSMDHNADLQAKLIGRLKNTEQFIPARYELFVAATMIRAGFEISLEDEDDRTSSHCEFAATHKISGRRFSVEAKCRTGERFRPGRQLQKALAKRADHERLVFIELGIGNLRGGDEVPRELKGALQLIRRQEGTRNHAGEPLPPAYVFITNSPAHLNLDSTEIHTFVLGEGFQIPDFKLDSEFSTLREAIDAHARDKALFEILDSAREHSFPPVTFDGEIEEYALGVLDPAQRLVIGRRYHIPDGNGGKRAGILTSATVAEPESKVYAALYFEDGAAEILVWDMPEAELDAWRRHPDTFFGEPAQKNSQANGPLDLYEFFHNGYRETPHARLLELLRGAPDWEQLRTKSQAELVSIYAQRMTLSVMARHESSDVKSPVQQA